MVFHKLVALDIEVTFAGGIFFEDILIYFYLFVLIETLIKFMSFSIFIFLAPM